MPTFSAHLGYLFTDLALERRFAQMARPMGDAAPGEKGITCLPDRAAIGLDHIPAMTTMAGPGWRASFQ